MLGPRDLGHQVGQAGRVNVVRIVKAKGHQVKQCIGEQPSASLGIEGIIERHEALDTRRVNHREKCLA